MVSDTFATGRVCGFQVDADYSLGKRNTWPFDATFTEFLVSSGTQHGATQGSK